MAIIPISVETYNKYCYIAVWWIEYGDNHHAMASSHWYICMSINTMVIANTVCGQSKRYEKLSLVLQLV